MCCHNWTFLPHVVRIIHSRNFDIIQDNLSDVKKFLFLPDSYIFPRFPSTHKKLEEELEHLKVVKRKEVAGKIKEAREQGDLSENAAKTVSLSSVPSLHIE